MGTAYLAMHAETEMMLVVKRMHPELIQDEGIFKRFVHEAEVAVHVRHPNVAALVAMGKIETEPFLATEYVFGIPVNHIVDRVESSQIDLVPLSVGLSLAVDLASGMEAIHSARHQETGEALGLIHRDIGSRNVLVGFDGQLRIIDLGLGKSILSDWQTSAQMLAGSPDYMPPEQAMGARVDGRADIYSASVTIWELLAGKKRIREEGVAARITRAIQAQPELLSPFRPDASKRLEAVLKHAMNPDPELRMPTSMQLKKALQEELAARGKKTGKEDVVAWLEIACATVIAKEKRLLADAREMAKRELGTSGARTVFLAARPGGPFEASPYEFYGPVPTTSAISPNDPAEHRPEDPAMFEKLASSPSVAALAALVDPANFKAQPRRVRILLALAAMIFLVGIATITALLVRPPTPDVQVLSLPNSEVPSKVALPAKMKETAEVEDPPVQVVEETVEVAETTPDAGLARIDHTSVEPRVISADVSAKKSELVRRIRQARRLRFDVNFQKKITALSSRLSRARTMRALDEIEGALIRLEGEN
jgi:serine/threonine-protein kinase